MLINFNRWIVFAALLLALAGCKGRISEAPQDRSGDHQGPAVQTRARDRL